MLKFLAGLIIGALAISALKMDIALLSLFVLLALCVHKEGRI